MCPGSILPAIFLIISNYSIFGVFLHNNHVRNRSIQLNYSKILLGSSRVRTDTKMSFRRCNNPICTKVSQIFISLWLNNPSVIVMFAKTVSKNILDKDCFFSKHRDQIVRQYRLNESLAYHRSNKQKCLCPSPKFYTISLRIFWFRPIYCDKTYLIIFVFFGELSESQFKLQKIWFRNPLFLWTRYLRYQGSMIAFYD